MTQSEEINRWKDKASSLRAPFAWVCVTFTACAVCLFAAADSTFTAVCFSALLAHETIAMYGIVREWFTAKTLARVAKDDFAAYKQALWEHFQGHDAQTGD